MTPGTGEDLAVVNARLVTVDRALGEIARGHLTARDGVITSVGAGDPPGGTAAAAAVVDAEGGLVHPGLIDGHAHVGWGLLRSVTPLGTSPHDSYERYEAPLVAVMRDEDEHLGALVACAEMALSGTTCYADTGSAVTGLDPIATATDAVGVRGMIAHFCADEAPLLERVHRSTRDSLRLVERGLADHPRAAGRLVWACAGLLGGGAASAALLRGAKRAAVEHGAVLNLHYSFDDAQVAAQHGSPTRQIERLSAMGVLDRGTTLVHVNVMSAADVRRLVADEVPVVHCPGATLFYGPGAARPLPFGAFRRAGGVLALGTDSVIFPNDWSLARQAVLAASLQHDGTPDGPMTAAELLHVSTAGGARAVGRDDLGALAPGKRADLVVHHPTRWEQAAASDPLAAFLFSGARSVRHVYVDGRAVVRDGRVTALDQDDVWEEAAAAARRLRSRARLPGPAPLPGSRGPRPEPALDTDPPRS